MIATYQDVFYYGTMPGWRNLAFSAGFAIVILLLSLVYFNRHRDSLGEYV